MAKKRKFIVKAERARNNGLENLLANWHQPEELGDELSYIL